MDIKQIKKVREKISAAKAIAVLTGAGISADSVFHFPWRRRAVAKFQSRGSGHTEAFDRDPRLVWEWYNGDAN